MPANQLPPILESARKKYWKFGLLLELGPGRAWPGLALLQREPDLELVGLGYSEEERVEAVARARELKLGDRAEYRPGELTRLPLADRSADGVVSFGGLHHWSQPLTVLAEIRRVLKPGGKYFLGDVRRDASWLAAWLPAWSAPGAKAVYRERPRALPADQVAEWLRLADWPEAAVQVAGPDLWICAREA